MIMRDAEGSRWIGQAIEQVGAPQRPIGADQLRGRLAPPVRMSRQLPQLDPDAMLHRRVIQVDLEPMPDQDGSAGQGKNVLHGASNSVGATILPGGAVLACDAVSDARIAVKEGQQGVQILNWRKDGAAGNTELGTVSQ